MKAVPWEWHRQTEQRTDRAAGAGGRIPTLLLRAGWGEQQGRAGTDLSPSKVNGKA